MWTVASGAASVNAYAQRLILDSLLRALNSISPASRVAPKSSSHLILPVNLQPERHRGVLFPPGAADGPEKAHGLALAIAPGVRHNMQWSGMVLVASRDWDTSPWHLAHLSLTVTRSSSPKTIRVSLAVTPTQPGSLKRKLSTLRH